MDLHLPQNETEAEWMQKAGYRWIADNAPHKLTDLAQDLTAANKVIVVLSEALDGLVNESLGHDMPGTVWRPFAETLTTHADTIKRAKEST